MPFFMADNYCMSATLEFYTCYTLVDITNTGVIKVPTGQTHDLQRNQQRNWETLLQVLSLRTQPMMIDLPKMTEVAMVAMKFGSQYGGIQRVWQFSFAAEYAGIYSVESLSQDTNQVPCIDRLDETIQLPLPIFSTTSDYCNTYFVPGRI